MTKEEIIQQGQVAYKSSSLLNKNTMHYCPGCSHGVVHKLVAEVIEEMELGDKSVGVSPVGCGVFMYKYLDIDFQEAAHGRAAAVATAIKRVLPNHLVSLIKEMETLPVSVPTKRSMRSTAVKALPSSLSTMPSTA